MESVLEVPEHKHPLKLIDLQLQYEEEEEEEDEDGYPIMKDGFHGVTCRRCEEEIHVYHRYYYTCCSSSCDDKKVFSLHKFCAELPIRHDFVGKEDHWIYKCDKCLYYVHLDCAISLPPPAGFEKTIKNYEDVDHPGLLHLPFPDETYSLPKHYLFFQQSSTDHRHHKIKVNDHLTHDSHQHPLILVDGETQIDTKGKTSSKFNLSSSICHDPMKKTQLLCNGCLRPIMSTMPFYICANANANANANDDEIQIQIHGVCNKFALHYSPQ
ncbi:unnamed protein product [Lactuca saligna]|uniref:DC1 domain-containing protein n=1 Tax=Lactuca saligna TaxID=75948 RepID=A0AA36EIR0_LACSI|nr:unnamed protein product [Lactuca saligna]